MTVNDFIREQAAKQVAAVANDGLIGAADQKAAAVLGMSIDDVATLRAADRLDSALLSEILRRQMELLRHLMRLVEALERHLR